MTLSHPVLKIIFSITLSLFITFAGAQMNTDKLFTDSVTASAASRFITTSDSGFAYCGSFTENQVKKGNLVKIAPGFGFQWGMSYMKGISSSGLSALDMMQLKDNGYLVLCEITDSITSSSYTVTMAIMRTDSVGNLIYIKALSDSVAPFTNEPVKLSAITDTTFYIVHTLWGSNGSIGVSKMHIDGSVIKSTSFYLEPGNHTDVAASVMRLLNGTFLITGTESLSWSSTSELLLFCLDDDANILWNKGFYASLTPFFTTEILQDVDSTILIAGQVGAVTSSPCLFKINQSGDLLWCKKYSPTPTIHVDFRTIVISGNRYYAAGTNAYALSYIPFILQLDTAGNILTSETYRHSGQQYFIQKLFARNDSLFTWINTSVSPTLRGTGLAILDTSLHTPCSNDSMTFSVSTLQLSSQTYLTVNAETIISTDITAQYQANPFTLFEVPLCSATPVIDPGPQEEWVSVFPNPAGSVLNITLQRDKPVKIMITDAIGKTVYSESSTDVTEKKIDIHSIQPGLYFLIVRSGDRLLTRKFVKE